MATLRQFRPSDNHWRIIPNFKERVTKPQLQYTLLYVAPPVGHDWAHKHLGVGVYELYVAPMKQVMAA